MGVMQRLVSSLLGCHLALLVGIVGVHIGVVGSHAEALAVALSEDSPPAPSGMSERKPLASGGGFVVERRPADFSAALEIACCFLWVDDRCLFLERNPRCSWGTTWGIPGGKKGRRETALQAVIREVQEETCLCLMEEEVAHLKSVYIRDAEKDFVYHMYVARLPSCPQIVLRPEEHVQFKWLTLQEAVQLSLIPGEVECIELVYGAQASVPQAFRHCPLLLEPGS